MARSSRRSAPRPGRESLVDCGAPRRFDDDLLFYDVIEEEGPDAGAVLPSKGLDAVEEAAVFQHERQPGPA